MENFSDFRSRTLVVSFNTGKMLCIEGRISLTAFTTFAVLALYQVKILFGDYWSYKYSAVACTSAVICVFVLPYTETIKRAALLGTFFGGAFMLVHLLPCPWSVFCVYVVFLTGKVLFEATLVEPMRGLS